MHAAPLRDHLPAHQQRLYRLPAGAELRCLRGALVLVEGSSGMCPAPRWLLQDGQAWQAPHPVWLQVTAQDGAALEITWPVVVTQAPKENRQGLVGLWRRWLPAVRRTVSRARPAV